MVVVDTVAKGVFAGPAREVIEVKEPAKKAEATETEGSEKKSKK